MLLLWGVVGLLLVSTQSIYAQESPGFEKIRDVSPDGLRISCSSEPADPDIINPNLITASETRFTPVKNRQASSNVKEKHPSNE